MTNLILRTYRIRREQDPIVKKLSKKLSTKKVEISESQIVRDSIDTYAKIHEQHLKNEKRTN